jgi:phage-related protein
MKTLVIILDYGNTCSDEFYITHSTQKKQQSTILQEFDIMHIKNHTYK